MRGTGVRYEQGQYKWDSSSRVFRLLKSNSAESAGYTRPEILEWRGKEGWSLAMSHTLEDATDTVGFIDTWIGPDIRDASRFQ